MSCNGRLDAGRTNMDNILTTVLTFCMLLVLSSGSPVQDEDGHMTLTYSYVGQMLTGVDSCDHVYSGLLVECLVKIQNYGSDHYLLKLYDVTLKKYIGQVDGDPVNVTTDIDWVCLSGEEEQACDSQLNIATMFKAVLQLYNVTLKKYIGQVDRDPATVTTDMDWVRLGGEEEQAFVSQLNITTLFHMNHDNQISDIYSTSENEHQWSLNMKKGILNFLQYHEEPGVYTRKESGVHGNCDVLYNVVESDFEDEIGTKYISKVWDLDSCDGRPKESYVYGIHGFPTKHGKKGSLISSQSQGTFQVSMASLLPKLYDELSGEIRGTHVVRPFSDNGKSVVSYTSQKLLFLNQNVESELELDVTRNIHSRTTLKMVLRESANVPEESSDINQQVAALLTNIVNGLTIDESLELATSEFILLIQKLRQVGDEQLRELIELYGRRADSEDEIARQKREIFEDALPIVGSTIALLDVIDKIGDNVLAGERAAWLLSSIAFARPNITVLNRLLHVCINKTESNDLALAGPCYLAFGSLVHTVCVAASPEQALANGCTEEHKTSYNDALSRVKVSTNSTVNMINKIYVKAAGNAGIHTDSQIPVILRTAMEMSPDLQTQTIYSLRRVMARNATVVQNVLLPIYLDTSVNPETRMAASHMLVESRPPPAILQMIASSLKTERDPQVASFSYSHLQSLTTSTYGQYKVEALKALTLVGDREFPILHHSKSYRLSHYDYKRKLGVKSHLNTIFQPDYSLPTAANLKIAPSLFFYSLNLFEMGMRLDWEPSPVSATFDLPDSPELDAINHQLGLTPEQLKTLFPKLSVYLKAFGNEFRDFSITSHQALQMISYALAQRQKSLKMKKMLSLGEGAVTISTNIGIPLSLNVSTAASVALKSDVAVGVMGIGAKVNFNASAMVESHLSAQIADIVQSGVGIRMLAKAHLPLDGEVGLDGRGGYRLRLKNIKPKQELFLIRSDPFVFIVRKERKPVGYSRDEALPKYESRELSSETCQGSWVINQTNVIGKQNGLRINISTNSVQDGNGIVLSGPYEKKVMLVSSSKEIQVTFKATDTIISIEDLLARMDPHSKRFDVDDSSSDSSSSSSSDSHSSHSSSPGSISVGSSSEQDRSNSSHSSSASSSKDSSHSNSAHSSSHHSSSSASSKDSSSSSSHHSGSSSHSTSRSQSSRQDGSSSSSSSSGSRSGESQPATDSPDIISHQTGAGPSKTEINKKPEPTELAVTEPPASKPSVLGLLFRYFFEDSSESVDGDSVKRRRSSIEQIDSGSSSSGDSSHGKEHSSSRSGKSSSAHTSSHHGSSHDSSSAHSSGSNSSSSVSSSSEPHSSGHNASHSSSHHDSHSSSHKSSHDSSHHHGSSSHSHHRHSHHHGEVPSDMKKKLRARQYLLNVRGHLRPTELTHIDAVTGQNHTTLMSLVTAFSQAFLKLWNLEIFPATTMDESMPEQPYRMFCAQSVTELPDPNNLEAHPMVRSKVTGQWGRSCDEDQKIVYKFKLENSPRDQGLIAARSSLQEECDLHKDERGLLSEECEKLKESQGDLKVATLEATHNGIEKRHKVRYYRFIEWLESIFSRQAARDYVDVHNVPNKLLWKWSTLERKDRVNLAIKNPSDTINFTRMSLPFELPTYNYNNKVGFLVGKLFGKCKVGYDGLFTTFDQLLFGYNLTQCYHVLAEDSTVSQQFSVLSRKSTVESGKDLMVFLNRTIKIEAKHSDTAELELFVQGVQYSNRSNNVIILKNGTVFEQEKERGYSVLRRWKKDGCDKKSQSSELESPLKYVYPASQRTDKMSGREQEHFTNLTNEFRTKFSSLPAVEPTRDGSEQLAVIVLGDVIEIHSRLLHVQFDGKNIIVQVSPKYHHQTLGICGTFTGASYRQFVGPDKTVYDDGIQAAVTYQNVTDACSPSGCVLELKFVYTEDCRSVSMWPKCSSSCSSVTTVLKDMLMKCSSGGLTKRVVRSAKIHTACSP